MQVINFDIAIYLNNIWGWNYGFISLDGIDIINDKYRLLPCIGFVPRYRPLIQSLARENASRLASMKKAEKNHRGEIE